MRCATKANVSNFLWQRRGCGACRSERSLHFIHLSGPPILEIREDVGSLASNFFLGFRVKFNAKRLANDVMLKLMRVPCALTMLLQSRMRRQTSPGYISRPTELIRTHAV